MVNRNLTLDKYNANSCGRNLFLQATQKDELLTLQTPIQKCSLESDFRTGIAHSTQAKAKTTNLPP